MESAKALRQKLVWRIQRTEEPGELYHKDTISKIQAKGNATVMGSSGG